MARSLPVALRTSGCRFNLRRSTKRDQLARQTGRDNTEVLGEVIDSYFEELGRINATLDRRYDETKSGEVKPMRGRRLRAPAPQERATTRGARMTEFRFHPKTEIDLNEIPYTTLRLEESGRSTSRPFAAVVNRRNSGTGN